MAMAIAIAIKTTAHTLYYNKEGEEGARVPKEGMAKEI
jgi:hypothetical protein